jgi:DNA mismatch repair protein MutS2
MDRQSLRVLEFQQIQRFLQSLALTEPGRQAALEVHPCEDREQIEVWLDQVTELKEYLQIGNSLPLGSIQALTSMLERIGASGEALLPEALLEVAGTLRATGKLYELASHCETRYQRLADLLRNLQPIPELEKKIGRAIDRRGRIKDGASPELSRVRKEITDLRQRLHNELTEILERQASQKTLQDKLISVRNDRLVIPLRSEAKGTLEGIVHDTSHSGATCFVEPLAVVPLNNRLSQERSREREEQARILRELTDAVISVAEVIRTNEYWLGFIDCLHAKVRLSSLLHARAPKLNGGMRIRLLQASHPILALQKKAQESSGLPAALSEMVLGAELFEKHKFEQVEVVPIDLYLGEEQRTLIISGANTGGKTVSLKTLGLLGSMVQAGMHIPVAEGSEWSVLTGIFAEIGDEQDVRAHLSTFSAKVQGLVRMLNQVDNRSLVLLDEIGTGTDPAEGAALALAVLDAFRQRGAFVAVTTHYHVIKAYGMIHQGVENVAVAFDQETGRPTYQLFYGHPGTSNALQIAAELGMSPEIIEVAKGHLDPEEGSTIDLIGQLTQALNRSKTEEEELRSQRLKLERVQADLAREQERLGQSSEDILSEARQQSEALLIKAENELKSAIAHLQQGGMRQAMAAQKRVKKIREELSTALEAQVQTGGDGMIPDAVGQQVRLRGIGGSGTLIKLKDQGRRAEVQMGPKRVEVDTEALELLSGQQSQSAKAEGQHGIRVIREEAESYQESLHLVGLRVEEAIPLLDKVIDRAILDGCTQIQVVHGHGTGRLREAVQEFLAEHPVVKGFHPENRSGGGSGVTVVELKD